MGEEWVSVAASPPETPQRPPSPSPGSARSVPRYTPVVLVGFPARPHFRMINEPDAATAASNTNGWGILQDPEFDHRGLWTREMTRKWAELTTAISTPTQINEKMYESDKAISLKNHRPYDDDSRIGYLYDDEVDLKNLQHYHCDVDTMTGNLLPPHKHPRTLPALLHKYQDFEPDRKFRTSEDLIMQKVSSRKQPTKAGRISTPQKAYQEAILAVEEDLRKTKPIKPMVGHLYSVAKDVIFRPAVAGDTAAITSIYNAEVMGEGMAPDSKPVPVNNFQQILQACQANMKPFIVAVKNANRLADVSNWPNRVAFEDWLRLKKAQGEPIETEEEIVGFAFICPFDYGIWGSEGNAQYSARIRCFVNPKRRRQGIGRALVDLMLQMTVTSYSAKCDSDWKHKRSSNIFNRKAFENKKKYHRIFIEVFFKNRGDPKMEDMKTLLENQLGFMPMGHILGGYKTERGEESVFLDKLIWGMDAVHKDEIGWYEHDVREKEAS